MIDWIKSCSLVLLVAACLCIEVDGQFTVPSRGPNLDNLINVKDVPNLHQVNTNLYRGGQPTEPGIKALTKLGVRTIIDLRDDDDRALTEKRLVEAAGMRFVNLPLRNWSRPKVGEVELILAQINAAANQPVFVHCKRGSDRTGTVIAIYRMVHDGWDAKTAGDEAEQYGIGWWQRGMRDFINDYYRDRIQKNEQRH